MDVLSSRTDVPSHGDVLITTKGGDHYLSIIPYPHRMSFSQLPKAIEMAARWAKANHANVWRDANGEVVRLQLDKPTVD
jgi:hypothetical protein